MMKLIVDENLLSFKVFSKKYSIMFVNLAARLPSRFWKPMIQSLQKVAIKSIIGEKGNEKPVSKRYMAK